MLRRFSLLLLVYFLTTTMLMAQNKAVVLQNLWNNELDNYTPKEFVDKVSGVFKEILSVKDITQETSAIKVAKGEPGWDKQVQEQIAAKKARADSAYFITISSDLRLPTFNLGKFLFKNPPRSSKLTFTFHIYDGTGKEMMGDTIINRGCIVKTANQEKGTRFFYGDYKSFLDDMECHLAVIRKILQEKQQLANPKDRKKT